MFRATHSSKLRISLSVRIERRRVSSFFRNWKAFVAEPPQPVEIEQENKEDDNEDETDAAERTAATGLISNEGIRSVRSAKPKDITLSSE